ncbi:ABC transporter ATP-binding protein [Chachezhania antarctica]|uniref:ABC transporter ATP-binding protein n=1 Tax=Chachezhania antarctica TaxID=2340860 RepID=UPI000EB31435|nr:ABC transporter ATP-binding protein [Chachezhania antarctica]|tara:strand:+ start:6674 stop:7711 length:1038 start_codon:yes stop_codon:yes gene_type:complete
MKHSPRETMIAPQTARPEPLLVVRGLSVTFATDQGPLKALDAVDLTLAPGETLAVVGESGSGKSVLSLALMGLLPPTAKIEADALTFDGRDLTGLREPDFRTLRGTAMSMIFQEPATALNPVRRIGDQIVEAIRLHEDIPAPKARARAIEALAATGIPAPAERAGAFPHQLSGGMRQRALIAMALVHRPRLLIADEPTTALDVTVQAQILDLIRDLARETGTATLFITHDMGVVAEMADRVSVFYAGRLVETAPAPALFSSPEHPYTVGLLGSMPQMNARGAPMLPIRGTVPDPRLMPPGCHFHPRCPFAAGACRTDRPALREIRPGQASACHLAPLIETLEARP